jgi:hypothetical protein
LGKGQGHEHGEWDVARRVCGHDYGAPGAGRGALSVLGLDITHAGVAGKRHEDPMFVGANVKSEGQNCSAVSCVVRYIGMATAK